MNAAPQPDPAPDINAIARFTEVVFGYLDGYAAIRLLGEKGGPDRRPRSLCHPIEGLGDELGRLALAARRDGRGLYIVPGAMARRGKGSAAEIARMGVLLVDLDTGDIAAKRAHLIRHIGPPTLEVASGGLTREGQRKLHLYWRLTEAADGGAVAEVCRLRTLVASKVGGDPAFGSAHQLIRVAGSVHGKHGLLTLAEIVGEADREYELGDLASAIEAMPPFDDFPPDTNPPQTGVLSATNLLTRQVRAGGVDGITRFEALSKVIGHWLRRTRTSNVTLREAWRGVCDYNAEMIVPPWPVPALRREFDALRALDFHHHPETADCAQEGSADPVGDDALASAFTAVHGEDWKHVLAWGQWFEWSGTVWRSDETGRVWEFARQICRSAAANATPAEARRITSDKTIRAVERLARTDPRHAARVSDWDRAATLLNTPSGMIDLATGEVLAHQRDARMTRLTGAALCRGCPRWLRFIEQITGADQALAAYLARVAGYCLTAETNEQVFFFLHGPGANGKSVFLAVLAAVLGDYAATAPLATFMAGRDQHPTDLAGLRGARLVTVTETETGRAWAESRIKAITGSDMLRVRFMHQDFFEFQPTFKLIVAGNHRPRLTGVGEAMRRRLHLIPFPVTIAPEQRDKDLLSKLLAERDGILGWMLDGCADWRSIGLDPPSSVLEAAQEYFDGDDFVGQWIAEACVTGPNERAASQVLFANWSQWAEAAGIEPGCQRDLGEQLRIRGCAPHRSGKVRGWRGISLRRGSASTVGEE